MSDQGSDQVSPKLSPQYAWRVQGLGNDKSLTQSSGIVVIEEDAAEAALAAEMGLESAEDTATSTVLDSQEANRLWFAPAEEISALTDKAWSLSRSADSDAAELTERLIAQATESPFLMTALSVAHPLQTVRLLRLALRYYQTLGESAHSQMLALCLPAHLTHPETTELLIEVAQAGDQDFGHWLGFPLSADSHDDDQPEPMTFLEYFHLTPRLCEIIDSEKASWESRELATEWLLLSCTIAALPTLRRALRVPHLGVRWRALAVLLYSFTPCELSMADLQFLIADLFVHPPPMMRGTLALTRKGLTDYPDSLTQAIARLCPPDAVESLLRIVRAEDTPRDLYRGSCSDRWALSALAAAYPEQALGHIDSYLQRSSSHSRYHAIDAVVRLPEPLARPRLFRAAMDGAPLVADSARRAWEQLYGVPFDPGSGLSADPVAGVRMELGPLADLLQEAPSELLPSRLAILRSDSEQARQAMIEVLLREAPNQESLALIVFAMADDMLLFRRHRKRLPADFQKLCFVIYRRFGEQGLRALCELADRYPAPDGAGGLQPLFALAHSSVLRKRDAGPLRELAVRRLLTGNSDAGRTALMILAKIGAPDSLRPRLIELLLSEDRNALDLFAASVLALRPHDRVLETELRERIEAAYQAQDWHLLRRLCYALPKRAGWALQLATSLLARWSAMGSATPRNCNTPEMAWQGSVEHCVDLLNQSRKLPPDWLDSALAAPSQRAFLVATQLVRTEADLTPARRASLRSALTATDHGGAAALETAVTLLRLGQETEIDDPRLLQLLRGAQGEWRARLLGMMLYRQPFTVALRPFLGQCLCTDDAQEAESIAHDLRTLIEQGHQDLLTEFLPQIRIESLAEELRYQLEPDSESSEYWQDRRRSR